MELNKLVDMQAQTVLQMAKDEELLRQLRRRHRETALQIELIELRVEAAREELIALGGRLDQADAAALASAQQEQQGERAGESDQE